LLELASRLEIRERVRFAGWLGQGDLWSLFRHADLFVMPSRREGMPNALLEALGCNLPCMGSDIPGIRDVLFHRELIFDPLDPRTCQERFCVSFPIRISLPPSVVFPGKGSAISYSTGRTTFSGWRSVRIHPERARHGPFLSEIDRKVEASASKGWACRSKQWWVVMRLLGTGLRDVGHQPGGFPVVDRQSVILGTSLTIGGLTIAVHLLSMVKELFVAAWFGTSEPLDAFLMAMVVPTFVINVMGGAFPSALIPIYIQVREQEGHDASQELLSRVTAYGLLLFFLLIASLSLLAPFLLRLLASGFRQEKLALTQMLFYGLLPCVVIQSLAMVGSAVLNAGGRFALAAIAPATLPVAILLTLFPSDPGGGSQPGRRTVLGYLLVRC